MCPGRPTQEDLDRLLAGLRRKVTALFEARAVPDEEAVRLVAEVVMEAAWRWNRLHYPARLGANHPGPQNPTEAGSIREETAP